MRWPASSRPPRSRSLSPGPTSTPAAAGTPRSRWPRSSGSAGWAPPPPAAAGPGFPEASPAPGGGRLGFPESHPNFQGTLPPGIGAVASTIEGADIVLVVGSSVFPYYPYIPGPPLPEGCELVAITSDPDEAARAPMGDAIVADVRLTLEALLAEVGEATDREPP